MGNSIDIVIFASIVILFVVGVIIINKSPENKKGRKLSL